MTKVIQMVTFNELRNTEEGTRVLSRLVCGGRREDDRQQARQSLIRYSARGDNKDDVYIKRARRLFYKEIPRDAKLNVDVLDKWTSERDVSHNKSYKNGGSNEASNVMFEKRSYNRSRGGRDMHETERKNAYKANYAEARKYKEEVFKVASKEERKQAYLESLEQDRANTHHCPRYSSKGVTKSEQDMMRDESIKVHNERAKRGREQARKLSEALKRSKENEKREIQRQEREERKVQRYRNANWFERIFMEVPESIRDEVRSKNSHTAYYSSESNTYYDSNGGHDVHHYDDDNGTRWYGCSWDNDDEDDEYYTDAPPETWSEPIESDYDEDDVYYDPEMEEYARQTGQTYCGTSKSDGSTFWG